METLQTEYLIIGSGIAGLRAAIELANRGKKVILATKSKVEDCNTYYAQGGAAAVDPIREDDNAELHAKDTLKAGDGLCDKDVTGSFSLRAFPDVIQFLIDNNVKFSKSNSNYPYELHQEGGHSRARVYCVGDYTGRAIEERLSEIAKENPNITILENHSAINLVTYNQVSSVKLPYDMCLGAYVLDRNNKIIKPIQAKKTFLATGGAGRAFQFTSNPENATGDGIAMAYNAGARIANMEFFQFHPSVLYEKNPADPAEKRFLITEALRGEKLGGILTLTPDSLDDFVLKYTEEGSHGTRDVVARAIDTEIKSRGLTNVFLNVTTRATGKSEDYLKENFPDIYKKCLEKGINMATQPIPVIPAAHYLCGGVLVNEFGLTDITGLYAIGEVSCTGLMGANRLASNSLVEGALYGKLSVLHALNTLDIGSSIKIPEWDFGSIKQEADPATLNQFWDMTRTTMTNLCGIDRNEERLQLAVKTMSALADASKDLYWNYYPTHEIIELRNLTTTAKLIAESALARKESRGCHYRSDYPEKDELYCMPSMIHK